MTAGKHSIGETPPPSCEVPMGSSQRHSALPIPYTQVHTLLRRTFENVQDLLASLLMALLLVLSLKSLWVLGRIIFSDTNNTMQALSEIVFVLILMELYRLLIFYLREHRVSVALTVEVALVSTLREVMLEGVHQLEPWRLAALSLFLLVLGGLLALERSLGRWRRDISETDAR